jgi:hypothetical protein
MRIRPEWIWIGTFLVLEVALVVIGYGFVAFLVAILAAAWPISERWSREYAHRIDKDAEGPEPGTPFEQHRP